MILTDREIKIAVERDLIQIDPKPDEAAFSSTAVDLTLDATIRTFTATVRGVETVVDPSQANVSEIIDSLTDQLKINQKDGYLLPPKVLMLAWTREYVGLSIGTRLAARVEGKSSLARLGLGVHVTAPTIHAGFTGQIQLEMINHGLAPIRLRVGMRICQLIFETTLGTPERGYQGQFSGQTATTAPKPKKKTKTAR